MYLCAAFLINQLRQKLQPGTFFLFFYIFFTSWKWFFILTFIWAAKKLKADRCDFASGCLIFGLKSFDTWPSPLTNARLMSVCQTKPLRGFGIVCLKRWLLCCVCIYYYRYICDPNGRLFQILATLSWKVNMMMQFRAVCAKMIVHLFWCSNHIFFSFINSYTGF